MDSLQGTAGKGKEFFHTETSVSCSCGLSLFLIQDQVGVARSDEDHARMVGDHGTRGFW